MRRTIVPLLLGLAFLGMAGSASAGTSDTRAPNKPVDLPETEEEKAGLAATVCQCVDEILNASGTISGESLRACVVDRWWPTTLFPPIAADPQSVKDAWALVTLYVQAYLDDGPGFVAQWCGSADGVLPSLDPGGDGEPSTGFDPVDPGGGSSQGFDPQTPPVDFYEGPVDMGSYPWETPTIHKGADGKHAPVPGMFFIIKKSNAVAGLDSLLEIARYALGAAYAMAGAPRSLSSIPGEEVIAYVDLIACSPWNDTAYGTSTVAALGGNLGLGPHGRGINMYARHYNNIAALAQGNTPQRTTLINGNPDSQAPATGNRWAQLWLPPINLEMLKDYGVITTQGLEWSNGDGVIIPPPTVWAHGVYSRVSAPGAWGCN